MRDASPERGWSPQVSRRAFLAGLGAGAGAGALALTSAPALADQVDQVAAMLPKGLKDIRRHFLLPPDLTYLNNGSLGPCPAVVLKATDQAWRQLEQDPAGQGYGPLLARTEEVRAKAAAFLGCDLDEIAVTRNTTEGMNAVAQGIDLRPGERVLTTDHEHPGGSVGWAYMAKRRGIHIDQARLPVPGESAQAIVAALAEKITPDTRVISVSHVTYSTGLRLPIARIAQLAREHGCLLVVDGAQGPGALEVNVRELGCHAYATSAHKWMLAPKGTGLLYVAKEAGERIDPLLLSAGRQTYTAATGTRDIPGILGLGAAIDFLNALGRPAIQAHVLGLRAMLMEALDQFPQLKVLSPPAGELASALVTVSPHAGVNIHQLAQALGERHGVIVSAKDHVNGIRISLHLYNTPQDVARLVAALGEALPRG